MCSLDFRCSSVYPTAIGWQGIHPLLSFLCQGRSMKNGWKHGGNERVCFSLSIGWYSLYGMVALNKNQQYQLLIKRAQDFPLHRPPPRETLWDYVWFCYIFLAAVQDVLCDTQTGPVQPEHQMVISPCLKCLSLTQVLKSINNLLAIQLNRVNIFSQNTLPALLHLLILFLPRSSKYLIYLFYW